jgi:hypothetical protein
MVFFEPPLGEADHFSPCNRLVQKIDRNIGWASQSDE